MELESLVAEKQQEVDWLNQQLKETQAGREEPKQEIGEEDTFGLVTDKIAALSQILDSAPTSLRTESAPKSSYLIMEQEAAKEQAPAKETASPPRLSFGAIPIQGPPHTTASPLISGRVNSAPALSSPVAVEPVSSLISVKALVAAYEAGNSSPPAITSRALHSPAISARATPSRVLYSPAISARSTAPPQFVYPKVATSQASAAYAQVSRPPSGAVDTAMEMSKSVSLPIIQSVSLGAPGSAYVTSAPVKIASI
mmetsp:Transcript_154620/g.296802  ORF Transcript_154620/g.296802 Transcript_154620/m.296802 type:complete len:255 (+) Transcript_154620:1-765(+)